MTEPLFESVPDQAIVRFDQGVPAGLPELVEVSSHFGYSLVRRAHPVDDEHGGSVEGGAGHHAQHDGPRSTLVGEIREAGFEALHNHWIALLTHGRVLPVNYPQPVGAPPTLAEQPKGQKVRVLVIDSALVAGTPIDGRISGNTRPPASSPKVRISHLHGTFVAGVILGREPRADIMVVEPGFPNPDGLITEWELAGDLARYLEYRPKFAVVNMSLGAYTEDDRGLAMLEQVIDRHTGDTLFVAAAGNNGRPQPVFPAGSPGVISVGALVADGSRPADFSNWWRVDAWAPGVGVVGPTVAGQVEFVREPEAEEMMEWSFDLDDVAPNVTLDGWAAWDGTSFAAPQVTAALAGLIAEGCSPDQARIEGLARFHSP